MSDPTRPVRRLFSDRPSDTVAAAFLAVLRARHPELIWTVVSDEPDVDEDAELEAAA